MDRCSYPTTTTESSIASATTRSERRSCVFRSSTAVITLGLAVVLAVGGRVVFAANTEAGREKAQLCVACHGLQGNSTNPAVPSLAGQPHQFVMTALFLFREGNRKDPQMTPIAANLSNADLNDLAAYF